MIDRAKIALTDADLELVRSILARHLRNHDVLAFGSRTTGRARAFSDLDLAIVGKEPVTLVTLAALRDEFVESDLRFKVDVVDLASASETFRLAVERSGITLLLSETA